MDNKSYRPSSTKVIDTVDFAWPITKVMEIGAKIREAREARGMSQAALAKAIGISQPAIRKIEGGGTQRSKYLTDIVRYLGLDEEMVNVPIVGYVGAGSVAHYYADAQGPFDTVPGPFGSNANTVAVEIRGDSLGPLFDRWLVFYDEVRSPVTSDLIGKLCIVGLADDRVLIKQLKRSRVPGLFHLLSQNDGPILDVEIVWAAQVKNMTPR